MQVSRHRSASCSIHPLTLAGETGGVANPADSASEATAGTTSASAPDPVPRAWSPTRTHPACHGRHNRVSGRTA